MSNVLVAGLHKSGTTGMYNALKQAVPRDPEPFFLFEPKEPQPFLSLGRYVPCHPIVAKVLTNRLEDCAIRYQDFDRRVMMIRDPRDVAVSRLLFRPMYGWTSYRIDVKVLDPFVDALKEKEADPSSHSLKGLHELADELGIGNAGWSELLSQMNHQTRVIEDEDFHVLRYEDFVDNNMAGVADYLRLPVSNPKIADDGWTGYIQRSMSYGDWRHWFLDEDVEFFGEMFAEYMKRFGYDDSWERPQEPHIDPATSSEYIAGETRSRILERQRRGESWTPDSVRTKSELRQLASMAEDGRAVWAYRLGLLYDQGGAFAPDRRQALAWARHGARLGNAKAMALTAHLLEDGADPDSAGPAGPTLEARFWRREHDQLTGRQPTTAARKKKRPRTAKRGADRSPGDSSPRATRSSGAGRTGGSRSTAARARRELEPLLGGTVRDSPSNAWLVLRRTGRKATRRVRRSRDVRRGTARRG